MGLAKLNMKARWRTPPHLELLNRVLVDVATRRIKRLIITLPPRHGKSELASKTFCAWYLGTYPRHHIILASYSDGLASKFGRGARDLLAEYGHVFNVGVSTTVSGASEWETVERTSGRPMGGGMITAGLGGSATGRGANLLIVDDPVKDAEQALSSRWRDKGWDWWESTATTRLEDDLELGLEGVAIVIQTRWHSDDLAGRLIQQSVSGTGERFTVLNLPALAEEGDVLGRAVGEALWPDRLDKARLEAIRATRSAYWWSAMYQQRPAPATGATFKRQFFRYLEVVAVGTGTVYRLHQADGSVLLYRPQDCHRFLVADCAVTENKTSDYTAIGHYATTPGGHLLCLDLVRMRVEGPDVAPIIANLFHRWQPAYAAIEANGPQRVIYQAVGRLGIPTQPLIPKVSKEERAIPLAMRMRDGWVYLNQSIHELKDLEDELLTFPKGAHDDMVDTMVYANDGSTEARPGVRVM